MLCVSFGLKLDIQRNQLGDKKQLDLKTASCLAALLECGSQDWVVCWYYQGKGPGGQRAAEHVISLNVWCDDSKREARSRTDTCPHPSSFVLFYGLYIAVKNFRDTITDRTRTAPLSGTFDHAVSSWHS